MENPYQFDIKIKSQNNNKRKYYFDIDLSKNSIEHKFQSQLSLSNKFNTEKISIHKRKNHFDTDLSSNDLQQKFKQQLTFS